MRAKMLCLCSVSFLTVLVVEMCYLHVVGVACTIISSLSAGWGIPPPSLAGYRESYIKYSNNYGATRPNFPIPVLHPTEGSCEGCIPARVTV
ncbi:hypothetical protein F4803DRAFT_502517 [Xylaria telfairii]|nr:hypothetical protein F4803DRAFT_502517 [Xylaria telfairii]